jgi:hypothetical protein
MYIMNGPNKLKGSSMASTFQPIVMQYCTLLGPYISYKAPGDLKKDPAYWLDGAEPPPSVLLVLP